MAKDTHPSYFTCVAEILSKSETPLSVDTLVSRIKMQRPVGSGVRSAVYQAISRLYQAIPVAPGRFGWFSCLLKDQYFRHSLSGHEVKKGDLLLDELEHAIFFPQFFQTHQPDVRLISIALMGGPTVQAHANIDHQDTWALRLGQTFVKWLDQSGGTVQDDLLIWVKDATRGEYGMRLQPKESRQEDLIRERNIVLARAAEQIVGGDRKARDTVPVWELAAALIGRNVYSFEVPPDDMHFVLHEYSNLQLIDDSGYTNRRQDEAAGSVASHSRRLSSKADLLSFHEFLREFILNRSDGPLAEFLNEGVFDISPSELEQSEHFPSDVAPETCKAYQTYLRALREVAADTSPLEHMEFHLLEAELEMLVSLEQEFGSLLLEQEERKLELADRLFIDLDLPFGGDWDQDDLDDLPFWNR